LLSAQAYSFHQKSKLAISLSWIGGYTNVIAFLALGSYASHMTGPITTFGRDLVERQWTQAIFFGFIIVMFFLGAVASAFMAEYARRQGKQSHYILPMFVEAVLLGLAGYGLYHGVHVSETDTLARFWVAGVCAMAMGLQNATITMISGSVIRTTHLTGVFTDLGLEGVQYLLWYRDRLRSQKRGRHARLLMVSQRHPSILRLLLLLSIIGSFLVGVVAGSFVYYNFQTAVMLPPILFLLFIVFMDWWRPIAEVREIDPLTDEELKLSGVLHTLLPRELGVCRLAPQGGYRDNRPPNFQQWAGRLPDHWRVVILCLAHSLRIDANAAEDLLVAIRKLKSQGRGFVLASVTPQQYAVLEKVGIIAEIGWENLCPDLEFALSRAMDLRQPQVSRNL